MLVAVTEHAIARYRQRVRGSIDERVEIASRVAQAHAAGRVEPGERGAVLVRDLKERELVFVCRPEGEELIVITLWERGDQAAVPKRFTDVLRRSDAAVEPARRAD
jgi:iron-sulfur cluster repair protein YtfE (RIC family)